MTCKLRKLCIAIALLFILILAVGCASSQNTTENSTKPAGEEKAKDNNELPSVLAMATNPLGSMFNNIGSGIAAIWGKYLPCELKVNPVSGHSVWIPMAENGEIDTAIINSYDASMAYLGQEEYEQIVGKKGADITLLACGSPGLNGILVSEDSGIKTGKDLVGKKYAGEYANSKGVTAQGMALLANQGLTPEDVQMVTVPGVSQGIQSIIDGRIDAAGSAIIGMGIITELDSGKGARLLSCDPSPEAVERMQRYYPYGFIVEVKPGPNKVGIIDDPTYLMGWDIYLVGRGDLSEETAYQLVKCIWEHDKDMAKVHPVLEDWTNDKYITTQAVIPYHPGAIKFYKEAGVWDQEMENLQQKLLNQKKN